MRKIPTLFVRDFEHDHGRFVTRDVTPGCHWALAGEGVATRKWDGTAVRFHEGEWWVRRQLKPGKTAPDGFVRIEVDDVTGKTVGWEPAAQSGFNKALQDVLERSPDFDPADGTYELCGPSINGNPDGFDCNVLQEHGHAPRQVPDRSYDGLVQYFTAHTRIEGLVFYRTELQPESGMVKIKRRDFRELAS